MGPQNPNHLVFEIARDETKGNYLRIRGIIEAESGYIGGEEGWVIETGAIYTRGKNLGTNSSFHMYS
jgi:hypothetical protein